MSKKLYFAVLDTLSYCSTSSSMIGHFKKCGCSLTMTSECRELILNIIYIIPNHALTELPMLTMSIQASVLKISEGTWCLDIGMWHMKNHSQQCGGCEFDNKTIIWCFGSPTSEKDGVEGVRIIGLCVCPGTKYLHYWIWLKQMDWLKSLIKMKV